MRKTTFLGVVPLLAPVQLLLLGVVILPSLHVIWLSFHASSFGQAPEFTDWSNYTRVLSDPAFRSAMWNTVIIVVVAVHLEPLNGAALHLVAAVLAGGPWAAAALAALWYGAETALALREGWPSRTVDVLILPVRDLMLPAIWLATLRNTTFEWRGNAMGPGALTKLPG